MVSFHGISESNGKGSRSSEAHVQGIWWAQNSQISHNKKLRLSQTISNLKKQMLPTIKVRHSDSDMPVALNGSGTCRLFSATKKPVQKIQPYGNCRKPFAK